MNDAKTVAAEEATCPTSLSPTFGKMRKCVSENRQLRLSNAVWTVWDAEAIDNLAPRLLANPENCYHPLQFGVHSEIPNKQSFKNFRINNRWGYGLRGRYPAQHRVR